MQPAYLTEQGEKKNERYQFYVNGFEQSKRFRSLKVWMSFQHYGRQQIGQWVENNIDQARHLHKLVKNTDDFESATEPRMSAICLRYKSDHLRNDALTVGMHVPLEGIDRALAAMRTAYTQRTGAENTEDAETTGKQTY